MNNPETEQDSWFRQHVAPHESMLRGHLQSAFPTLPDVDDIVQESYFRLIQAKKTGTIRYAKAFLFATARNIALDLIRHRRVVSIQAVTEIDGQSVMGEDTGVVEAVSRQQELAFLADAIRALPERCRQIVTLRKLYGVSQKEIAAQLGISEHTVEVQVAKGMRRVAATLVRRGVTR